MSETGLDGKRADADFDTKIAQEAAGWREGDNRAAWIGELARADAAALAALWRNLGLHPTFQLLRGPEIGLVMARGRVGGEGAPFNVGEVAATRCVLRLETGEEGVAYALGRDAEKATVSALCDALMQTAARPQIVDGVLAPLARLRADTALAAAATAAATKVEFFTMTRGDDE